MSTTLNIPTDLGISTTQIKTPAELSAAQDAIKKKANTLRSNATTTIIDSIQTTVGSIAPPTSTLPTPPTLPTTKLPKGVAMPDISEFIKGKLPFYASIPGDISKQFETIAAQAKGLATTKIEKLKEIDDNEAKALSDLQANYTQNVQAATAQQTVQTIITVTRAS